jgi:hypothetical protein
MLHLTQHHHPFSEKTKPQVRRHKPKRGKDGQTHQTTHVFLVLREPTLIQIEPTSQRTRTPDSLQQSVCLRPCPLNSTETRLCRGNSQPGERQRYLSAASPSRCCLQPCQFPTRCVSQHFRRRSAPLACTNNIVHASTPKTTRKVERS